MTLVWLEMMNGFGSLLYKFNFHFLYSMPCSHWSFLLQHDLEWIWPVMLKLGLAMADTGCKIGQCLALRSTHHYDEDAMLLCP